MNARERAVALVDDWQPDERDPHERFGVPDPWSDPGWPLVSRIVAAATDSEPTLPQHGDGVDDEVAGLISDHDWRGDVALADAMGLVGNWGVDDVHEAVTEAAHRYRRELAAEPLDAKSRGPAYQRGRADGRLEQRASDGAVPAAAGERVPGPSGGGLVGPPAPEGDHVTRAQPFTDAELADDHHRGFGWFS